eukprot:g2705.t1
MSLACHGNPKAMKVEESMNQYVWNSFYTQINHNDNYNQSQSIMSNDASAYFNVSDDDHHHMSQGGLPEQEELRSSLEDDTEDVFQDALDDLSIFKRDTTSNERDTTSNERETTSNERETTSDGNDSTSETTMSTSLVPSVPVDHHHSKYPLAIQSSAENIVATSSSTRGPSSPSTANSWKWLNELDMDHIPPQVHRDIKDLSNLFVIENNPRGHEKDESDLRGQTRSSTNNNGRALVPLSTTSRALQKITSRAIIPSSHQNNIKLRGASKVQLNKKDSTTRTTPDNTATTKNAAERMRRAQQIEAIRTALHGLQGLQSYATERIMELQKQDGNLQNTSQNNNINYKRKNRSRGNHDQTHNDQNNNNQILPPNYVLCPDAYGKVDARADKLMLWVPSSHVSSPHPSSTATPSTFSSSSSSSPTEPSEHSSSNHALPSPRPGWLEVGCDMRWVSHRDREIKIQNNARDRGDDESVQLR